MPQRSRAGRPPGGSRPGGHGQAPAVHRDRLRGIVEPVISRAGYDLEELAVSRAGRRHLVRIIVDGDGAMGLDAIADVSRAVSAALDAAEQTGAEIIAGEYQLEVSSPGVDRPLTQPRHWRRSVGRLVKVRAGERQLTGRVRAASEAGVVLEVDGASREVAYTALGPGRVQIEFNRLDEVDDADLQEFDEDDEEIGAADPAEDHSGNEDLDEIAQDEEREDEQR